jgi:hypothetical protein
MVLCASVCHRLATLMQHAILAARTLVTHSCAVDERAALLGRIGASYGLGFALGPAVGGLMSSVSLTATAWAAAGGSLLAMGMVYLGLPEGMRVCVCVGGGVRGNGGGDVWGWEVGVLFGGGGGRVF